MASKMVSGNSQLLAGIVVDCVGAVSERFSIKITVDMDNIKVEKKPGGSRNDSQIVRGIVLDKEIVHGGMPKKIEKAKIALVNSPLEIQKQSLMLN